VLLRLIDLYASPGDAMNSIERLSKSVFLRLCGPRLRRKLRLRYLVWKVPREGGPKEPEAQAIAQMIRPGDSVADVGANVGLYTAALSALVRSEGFVYAFEPIYDNFLILEAVTRKARLTNTRLFHAALGTETGRREMIIPTRNEFVFAGYYQAHFLDGQENGEAEKVDVLTLDQLWNQKVFDRLDFLKCDVEGAELQVLAGGLSLVRAQRPTWLMEVSRSTSDAVFRTFRELGYQAFVYDGSLHGVEAYRDGEFSNYFFLHPASKIGHRTLAT
jgi:FkbM family methyltransferase